VTDPAKPKSPARQAAMRARMADPAFKAKAQANLERGWAALAAKRKQPPPTNAGDQHEDPPPTSSADHRRYGPTRWRE